MPSENGFGSSREQAAWAVRDFGIRAVVASSFATIFRGNCVRNGVLPVQLAPAALAGLHAELAGDPAEVTIDLQEQLLRTPSGTAHAFDIGRLDRRLLLSGLDPISLVLEHEPEITSFQRADERRRPWVYGVRSLRLPEASR